MSENRNINDLKEAIKTELSSLNDEEILIIRDFVRAIIAEREDRP